MNSHVLGLFSTPRYHSPIILFTQYGNKGRTTLTKFSTGQVSVGQSKGCKHLHADFVAIAYIFAQKRALTLSSTVAFCRMKSVMVCKLSGEKNGIRKRCSLHGSTFSSMVSVSQCKLLSKYELKGKYKGTAFKNCDWTAG
jgi:hypothetical protein